MVSETTLAVLFILAHILTGLMLLGAQAVLIFLSRRPAAEKIILEQAKDERKLIQTQDRALAARQETGGIEP